MGCLENKIVDQVIMKSVPEVESSLSINSVILSFLFDVGQVVVLDENMLAINIVFLLYPKSLPN